MNADVWRRFEALLDERLRATHMPLLARALLPLDVCHGGGGDALGCGVTADGRCVPNAAVVDDVDEVDDEVDGVVDDEVDGVVDDVVDGVAEGVASDAKRYRCFAVRHLLVHCDRVDAAEDAARDAVASGVAKVAGAWPQLGSVRIGGTTSVFYVTDYRDLPHAAAGVDRRHGTALAPSEATRRWIDDVDAGRATVDAFLGACGTHVVSGYVHAAGCVGMLAVTSSVSVSEDTATQTSLAGIVRRGLAAIRDGAPDAADRLRADLARYGFVAQGWLATVGATVPARDDTTWPLSLDAFLAGYAAFVRDSAAGTPVAVRLTPWADIPAFRAATHAAAALAAYERTHADQQQRRRDTAHDAIRELTLQVVADQWSAMLTRSTAIGSPAGGCLNKERIKLFSHVTALRVAKDPHERYLRGLECRFSDGSTCADGVLSSALGRPVGDYTEGSWVQLASPPSPICNADVYTVKVMLLAVRSGGLCVAFDNGTSTPRDFTCGGGWFQSSSFTRCHELRGKILVGYQARSDYNMDAIALIACDPHYYRRWVLPNATALRPLVASIASTKRAAAVGHHVALRPPSYDQVEKP